MVSVNRQRKKAIRVGVDVEEANKATTSAELIKLMQLVDEKKNARVVKPGDVVQPGELVKVEVPGAE